MNTEARRFSFVESQGVDADAAYERLAITRKTLRDFKSAINATNTVDVAGELKRLYDEVEATMRTIALEEQKLIMQGK